METEIQFWSTIETGNRTKNLLPICIKKLKRKAEK